MAIEMIFSMPHGRSGRTSRAVVCSPASPDRGMPMISVRSTILPLLLATRLGAQAPDPRLDRFKAEISRSIDGRSKFGQQMVDQVFSFGELGMQEFETSKYLT